VKGLFQATCSSVKLARYFSPGGSGAGDRMRPPALIANFHYPGESFVTPNRTSSPNSSLRPELPLIHNRGNRNSAIRPVKYDAAIRGMNWDGKCRDTLIILGLWRALATRRILD
jgi:hypothetical protein